MKKNLINLGLIILSVTLILLALEGAMRIAVRYFVSPELQERYRSYLEAKNPKFVPHPYLSYALTKNYVSKDGLNKHNSWGIRGEEITMPKPKGVFRIITLGGSTTYGSAVEDWREAYPAQMEKALKENYGYKNAEVINGGAGGYTSAELFINFSLNLTNLEPDMIIFSEAVNDTQPRFVCPENFRSDYSGFRKAWEKPWQYMFYRSLLAQFIGYKTGILPYPNLDQFVLTKEANSAKDTTYLDPDEPDPNLCGKSRNEILKENTTNYFEQNLRNLIAVAESRNIKVVFGTFGYDKTRDITHYSLTEPYLTAIEDNNNIIRKLAKEKNIPVIPFEEEVDNGLIPPTKEYWQNVHLLAPGETLKGKLFARFLAENNLVEK